MSMPVDEQKVLGRIAEQLATEDPALHASFRRFAAAHSEHRWPRPRTRRARALRRPRWAPAAVVVAGLALAVAGVVCGRPDLAFGGALLAACAPWLVAPADRHRRPTV